jgi:predicted amino acid racemase
MFLEKLMQENSPLIDAAIELHRSGKILPDTYVVDLDMIKKNTQIISQSAQQHNIELFFMTKQFGRNPLVAHCIRESGISHAVAVDFKEALLLMEHNIPLGNVGHLVQIPTHLLSPIMRYGTKYITIYSMQKLQEIDRVAGLLGIVQDILIKVVGKSDHIYDGQQGGICLEDLVDFVQQSQQLANIRIAGLTAFPCFLYDSQVKEIKASANAHTLQQAQSKLKEHGYDMILNMPSATSVASMPLLAAYGAHQGEPGHALSATTPDHLTKNLAEKQAMLYLSEVSHHFENQAYIYGGGYYRRSGLGKALVAKSAKEHHIVEATPLSCDAIDYHIQLNQPADIGDSVIMAFRTQIFATRSHVAVLSNVASGKAQLEGIYNSSGGFICASY